MKERSKNCRVEQGMTLPELLVVIGIISFLVIFAILYFRTQIFKGNDGKRKGDIHRIQVAIEEYEKDHNCYPLPSLMVCNPGTGLKPYLSKVPCDPVTKASYFYEYEDSVCPTWYRIYADLDNDQDQIIQDLGCSYGCGPALAYNFYLESPNAPAASKGTVPAGGGDGGTPVPTIPPEPDSDFYGCFGGVCTLIGWDPRRPGPECDPNYQNSTCYDQCSLPETECQPWGN